MEKIEINKEDLKDLYFLLEEMNNFFHQEKNFTTSKIKSFADKDYQAINKAYYETLWELLPEEEKGKVLDS